MPDAVIYIPIKRKLYDDIIRFSDGKVNPAEMAEYGLERWIENDLENDLLFGSNHWGDRFEDAASEYAPHLLEALAKDEQQAIEKQNAAQKPLVWKEVSIRAGSEVRMSYGGQHHYAKIQGGHIVEDDGKQYSPSEWASKVAGGTSRNAWRDLWFREPLCKTWVPAQLLRDQAQQEAQGRGKPILSIDNLGL